MKDEYIKRKDVEQMLEMAALISDGEYCGYCTEDIDINGIPAADVAPVVHGKDLAQPSLFECSVCGCTDDDTYTCDATEYHYCPNCGAKMDEKAKPEPSVVTIYKCSGCGTRFMEFSEGNHFCCFCGAEMYKEENACEADIETAT